MDDKSCRSYNGCTTSQKVVPKREWVRMFIHVLNMIPRNWYMLLKLRRGTAKQDKLSNSFKHTFSYVDEISSIDATLQVIKAKFSEEIFVLVSRLLQWTAMVQTLMKCYNILGEPEDDNP